MTTTSTPTFRKTKTGEWVAFGPAHLIHTGEIQIAKRDGATTSRTVERVGKTFQVNGVDCAYGYLADRAPATSTDSGTARRAAADAFRRSTSSRYDRSDRALERRENADCGLDANYGI